MGNPRKSRKKYETPSHPWQEDRIKRENELLKKYGLKNKREIWKAETTLRKYRSKTRDLLAKAGFGDPQYEKESRQLLDHLVLMNIIKPNSTLDDVLALGVEDILSRRLQTLVYLKGLASTPKQARQLIVHGHISIRDRRVTIPSYMVRSDEEREIGYSADSPLNDPSHPVRPTVDITKRGKIEMKIVEDNKEKVDQQIDQPSPVEPSSSIDENPVDIEKGGK